MNENELFRRVVEESYAVGELIGLCPLSKLKLMSPRGRAAIEEIACHRKFDDIIKKARKKMK